MSPNIPYRSNRRTAQVRFSSIPYRPASASVPKQRPLAAQSPSQSQRGSIPFSPPTQSPVLAPGATTFLSLTTPKEPFDPARSEALLRSLRAVARPLRLEIIVRSDAVHFGLRCQVQHRVAIERTLRGAVPAYSLTVQPEPLLPLPSPSRLCLTATLGPVRDDWRPLPTADSFTHVQVPTLLLEAVQTLQDEWARISFWIRPVPAARLEAARKSLQKVFAAPSLWEDLVGAKRPGLPRHIKAPDRLLFERLAQPALEVLGAAELVGSDMTRLQNRAISVEAVIANYLDAGWGGLALSAWQWQAVDDSRIFNWPDQHPTLYLTTAELASCFSLPSEAVTTPGVTFSQYTHVPTPLAVAKSNGLLLGHSTHRSQRIDVRIPLPDLIEGMIAILGASGSGKSVLAANLMKQILTNRTTHRVNVALIDPNNKLAEAVAASCIPRQRWDDTILLHLANTERPVSLGLFCRPKGVGLDDFIQTTYATFRLIFEVEYARMQDMLYGVVVALASQPLPASLLDVAKLFASPAYRQTLLKSVGDPVSRSIWQDFEQLSPATKRDIAQPILRRINALIRNPQMRLLFATQQNIDIAELLDSGKNILLATAGKSLGADATLLNELLLSQFQLAARARLDKIAESYPLSVLFYDESHLLSNSGALPLLMREGRKSRLPTCMIAQSLSSWQDEAVLDSILTNQSLLCALRLGPRDARTLAQILKPFTADDMETLSRYESAVRMHCNNTLLPAFHLRTEPPPERDEQALAYIAEKSRHLYTRDRSEVEAEFAGHRQEQPSTAEASGNDMGAEWTEED